MFFLLTFVTIHPNLVSCILLTPNAVMLQWRHSFFVFNLISKGSATLRCCALALRSRCPALASRSPHPNLKAPQRFAAAPSRFARAARRSLLAHPIQNLRAPRPLRLCSGCCAPAKSFALPGAHPTPLRDWAAHVSLADPR